MSPFVYLFIYLLVLAAWVAINSYFVRVPSTDTHLTKRSSLPLQSPPAGLKKNDNIHARGASSSASGISPSPGILSETSESGNSSLVSWLTTSSTERAW